VVHSVELTFDPQTDAAVRRIWDDLTAAGVRSQAAVSSPSNRPHVTVTVADRLGDGVDAALSPVTGLLPVSCVLGAPMLFGSRVFTLVRLVVPSAALLALHAAVHEACTPYLESGPLPHAAPGQWTPHVTLARRLTAEQLPVALTVPSVSAQIEATAVGLRHWDGEQRVEHPITY
jgi:hypothetical protein